MFSNMDIGQNIVYAIGGRNEYLFCFFDVEIEEVRHAENGHYLNHHIPNHMFLRSPYGQMMTSMTMVAINTMRGDLFGFIPVAPRSFNGNEPTVVYGCWPYHRGHLL